MRPDNFHGLIKASVRCALLCTLFAWQFLTCPPMTRAQESNSQEIGATNATEVIDLSLLVSPEHPCTWPANFPLFQINPYLRVGPGGMYNSEILTIDPNTGTQYDAPPHSIPRSGLKLPNASEIGDLFTDKIPAWQFCGEACVVDVTHLLDSAPDGRSPLVLKEHIVDWEKSHRELKFGDVVLLRSGYSDRYYLPFPQGRRFAADPVQGTAPAWPDPDPDCVEYIASRKVMAMGTDSPSMGPIPFLAEPTHIAGLRHGMIWTESATALDKLPVTGAFYCMLSPKHADGACGEARALAITAEPLAGQLIDSARNKRVADLSVVMSELYPVSFPGSGTGNHRQPYLTVKFMYNKNLDLYQHTHIMDSHSGTHLVPPAYALAPDGEEKIEYSATVSSWLDEYTAKFGPLGTSTITADKVPLSQTCGWARVIDVRSLVGSTSQGDWPKSPEITQAIILEYENKSGPLKPNEIVIFRTDHSDKYYAPLPKGAACMADPLNGKSEGWPALSADAVMLLAEKGIRCVATDSPTLGGVDPKQAALTYWALGSKGMAGIEYLTNLKDVPEGAFFIFAPVKVKDCHGGPGRAIVLY